MGEFRGSWCDTGVTMYGHWCHHVSDTGVTMYGHWCHHKKTTGYSHCLKTPTQVNASGGDFRQHKKTNSFKKTNVSKKTKTPARGNAPKPRRRTETTNLYKDPRTRRKRLSVAYSASCGG